MKTYDELTDLSTNLIVEINKVNKQLPKVLQLHNECVEIKKQLEIEDKKREKSLDTKLKKQLDEVNNLYNKLQKTVEVMNKKLEGIEKRIELLENAEKEKQNAILESAKNKFPQYAQDNSMILSLLIDNIDKLPIRIERPSWSNGYHFLISEFDKKCVYGDYYKMGVLHNPNQELRLEKTGYRLFKDEKRQN